MDEYRGARVVVGVALTGSGLQALRRAVAEARARGWPLYAVRVWQVTAPHMYLPLYEQRQLETAAASEAVAEAFAATIGRLPEDVEVHEVLAAGWPGQVLTDQASRDDDLLVVGAGRRGRWHRHSRTVRYCVAKATCPVLVVPPPALARAGSCRALIRELRRDLDQLA